MVIVAPLGTTVDIPLRVAEGIVRLAGSVEFRLNTPAVYPNPVPASAAGSFRLAIVSALRVDIAEADPVLVVPGNGGGAALQIGNRERTQVEYPRGRSGDRASCESERSGAAERAGVVILKCA